MMDRRIKILFTIPNFKTAGSQFVLLAIFKGINKEKFEPFIAVEKYPELIPDDIQTQNHFVFRKTGNSWVDIKNISHQLKNAGIDIVHSWDHKSEIFEAVACRVAGVKYIFTKKNNAWSKRWMFKSLLANHIAYDNPDMKKRFFSNNFLNKKTTFVPHGVDIKIFKEHEKIPHSSFNICSVGNISENKNQLLIIKSLLSLAENVHLHLYGKAEEEYLKKLKEYVRDNVLGERVHFHGFVENMELPEVFRAQDLFILASHNEGLPVSILEALACGVPVLSSDSGGGARYILKDEAGGYIFNIDQIQELIERINFLRENQGIYDQKRKQAINNIENRFKLDNEISTYENLYCRIK